MDEDEGNALEEFSSELEEHLYSKIHHGQVESEAMREAPQKAAGVGQRGKNGRYFAASGKPPSWNSPRAKRGKEPGGGGGGGQKFTPYQSFLESIKLCSQAVQKKNLRKNPVAFRKPEAVAETATPPKRDRAKKNRRKEKKKVQTIVLDSSEDEEKDDVVEIPVPPPPLVCLDSSDESTHEVAEMPKPQGGAGGKRRISPRGSSPSSSILSDDFIATQDRRRLAEAQNTLHVADEELRSVQQQTRGPQSAPKRARTHEKSPRNSPKAKLSDISTSDSEDFLPDADAVPQKCYQKRKSHPPSPKSKTTPYIHVGEAIPNAVTTPRAKRKSIDAALSTAHRSDEEFITILSSIANMDNSNSQAASQSDEDDVQLVRECPEVESGDIVINIGGNEETTDVPEAPKKSFWVDDGAQGEEEEVVEGEQEDVAVEGEQEEDEQQFDDDYPPFLLHGWNEEMRRFYEESWGGEKFSLQNIIRQMPDNNQWQINAKDLNFSRFHRTWREHQEMKLVCYMCGQSGHREPRCPNTLCLKCGNRAMVFGIACSKCSDWPSSTCEICHTKGHKADLCPDSWRRYHSTVEEKAPEEEKLIPNPRKFCSICAREGHLADSCPCPVRILEYPASPWEVTSYEGTYEVEEDTQNPKDPFHMHRGEQTKFTWSQSVKKSQFYGRFLTHCSIAPNEDGQEAPKKDIEEISDDAEEEAEPAEDEKNIETKIFLHRNFSKSLQSDRGKLVMKAMADEMSVEVDLRTSAHGILLKLRGEHQSVETFKQNLMAFLTSLTKRTAEEQQMDYMHFPRDRSKMLQFMRGKMRQLTTYIGNAPNLFHEMRRQENSKIGKLSNRQKMADRNRSMLNMILMGQAGLREGRMHLRALEADLAMLEKHHQDGEVPQAMRASIFLHFRYIFTPFRHRNYDELLKQFYSMKNTNKLPSIAIPRQTNHQRRNKPRYFKQNIAS
uniref:Zinc finger CCHC domain-containing protein 7 n=1 Tax=Lutzomyia longipalpis TaxID=7200 RepID=A0A1B0CKQ4_LUTLO